jgi:pyruvate formate lyase activating enzyme
MDVVAKHWKPLEEGKVQCGLCPHGCKIKEGGRGICGIRLNKKGKLIAGAYGIYPAVHLDPIEKKPLNHFLPGSSILSLGSIGCNMTCLHCQNWSLSRERPEGMENYYIPPDLLVKKALDRGSIGVAFTYNEPTINFEYIIDTAPELRKKGAKVVHVTNGHLDPGPWKEIMEHSDGANIDVKGFSEKFYREITGGDLGAVLENVKASVDMGVHVEIAYLVIPGHNDDDKQVDGFIDWILGDLHEQVPVHFNRFHPDHRMLDVPATSRSTLESIREKARKKGIKHVFIGNIGGGDYNDTFCPGCGKRVVTRSYFSARQKGLKEGKCVHCGASVSGLWK